MRYPDGHFVGVVCVRPSAVRSFRRRSAWDAVRLNVSNTALGELCRWVN